MMTSEIEKGAKEVIQIINDNTIVVSTSIIQKYRARKFDAIDYRSLILSQ